METINKEIKTEDLQIPKSSKNGKKNKPKLQKKNNYFDKETKLAIKSDVSMALMDLQEIIMNMINLNDLDLFEDWNLSMTFQGQFNSFKSLIEKSHFTIQNQGRDFFQNDNNLIVIDFAWLQKLTFNSFDDETKEKIKNNIHVHNDLYKREFVQNIFKHVWLLVASLNFASNTKRRILEDGKFSKVFQEYYIPNKSDFANWFEEFEEDVKWSRVSYPNLTFNQNSSDIVNQYIDDDMANRFFELMIKNENLESRQKKSSKKNRTTFKVVDGNGSEVITPINSNKSTNEVLKSLVLVDSEEVERLIKDGSLDKKKCRWIEINE